MYNFNKVLPQEQFDLLVELLPTPEKKKRGRPRVEKEALLKGIIQVLRLDIPWCQIYPCGCSYSSCYRYFRELQRRGLLKKVFKALSDTKTDIAECAVDTDTTTSFRFKDGTGWDGKHKKIGTKISLLSDKNGLPSDIEFGKGNKHDLRFLPQHIENTAGRRKQTINLDKIYTSLEVRRNLRRKGIRLNIKPKANCYTRKRGPKFKFDEEKYKVRFPVERCFAWLENFRRLKLRREYRLSVFKAFTYLAAIIVLLRN